MSRRIKKFASSLGLRSAGGDVQEGRRNVTPPSNTNPDDAFTTPPRQPADVADATPADDVITTPATPARSSPPTSLVKRMIEPFVKQSKSVVVVPKKWLRQGITGSDATLPIFDGSSMDIRDHLIDIDTDSMETAPDVRVYFWAVGYETHDPKFPDIPTDLEERKLFDARMVRTGREHLKGLKQQGLGWFLSSSREIATRNATDSEWYRTPTTGISDDISCDIISPLEDECSFFDDQDHHLNYVIATNMRIPLWWVETFYEGVVPGTNGWDGSIQRAYYEINHPGYAMSQGLERERAIKEVVWAAVAYGAGPVEKARQVLRRDWPDIAALQDDPYPEFIGPGYLELQNSTVDQFLGRTK